MLVGLPSTHKSPAIDNVVKPLTRLEEEISADYEEELKQWKTEKEKADIYNEQWQNACKKAVKAGDPLPDKPEQAEAPRVRRSCYLTVVFWVWLRLAAGVLRSHY